MTSQEFGSAASKWGKQGSNDAKWAKDKRDNKAAKLIGIGRNNNNTTFDVPQIHRKRHICVHEKQEKMEKNENPIKKEASASMKKDLEKSLF